MTQATVSDKQQGDFYMHFPMDRTAHTIDFDGPVVDHCLDQKITQTAPTMQVRSDDPNLYRRVLYGLTHDGCYSIII